MSFTFFQTSVDYSKLKTFLANGQWQEANNETISLLSKIATGFNTDDVIYNCSFDKLRCDGLFTINQLWLQYSQGHFGFSVQRKIWHDLGENYPIFMHTLGWLGIDNPWSEMLEKPCIQVVTSDQLTYSLSSPIGHLPYFVDNLSLKTSQNSEWVIPFFAQVMKCNL